MFFAHARKRPFTSPLLSVLAAVLQTLSEVISRSGYVKNVIGPGCVLKRSVSEVVLQVFGALLFSNVSSCDLNRVHKLFNYQDVR